jgi:hypothetical protein
MDVPSPDTDALRPPRATAAIPPGPSPGIARPSEVAANPASSTSLKRWLGPNRNPAGAGAESLRAAGR